MPGQHVLVVQADVTVRNVRCFGVVCACGWSSPRAASRSLALRRGDTHLAEMEAGQGAMTAVSARYRSLLGPTQDLEDERQPGSGAEPG